MDVTRLFRAHFKKIQPYIAVESPNQLTDQSGIAYGDIIKLNANENPYGPSPAVQEALARYNGYQIYPDSDQRQCRAALQGYTGLDESNIIVGAGADELIDLLLRATLEIGDAVIDCPPTFGMYAFSTQVNAGRLLSIPRYNDFTLDLDAIRNAIDVDTKIIFLASPNNPSGDIVREEDVLALLNENILVVIDETYFEFSGFSVSHLINKHSNLVVLRSMSKWAGLAGLRIGYALAAPELIRLLMEIKQPYNINAAAEVALLASLGDLDYLKNNIASIISERDKLFSQLCTIDGITPRPSYGNFVLCEISGGLAAKIYNGLANRGIFVRYFDTPSLKDSIRISVGKPEHTDILVGALKEIMTG